LTASIAAPDSLKSRLAAFIARENIALQFAISEHAEVVVHESSERRECGLVQIYCGGWIDCETARAMAEKLAIPKRDFGKLLNFLDIKVRNCALGCFQ